MKKSVIFIVTVYALIQNGQTISKAKYEGMDVSTVDGLLQEFQGRNPGTTYQIVNQSSFDAVPDIVPASIPTQTRTKAISDAKDTRLSPDLRLDALIKAIDLD